MHEYVPERRFRIIRCSPEYRSWPSCHVTTGFLDTDEAKSMRVRVERFDDGHTAIYLTETRGRGAMRPKRSHDITPELAAMMLKGCGRRTTTKRRYSMGPLRVDEFEGVLVGHRILEVKNVGLGQAIERPSWVQEWREVTGRLNNYTMAEHAAMLSLFDTLPDVMSLPEELPRAVLTAGPGGGKTSVLEAIMAQPAYASILEPVPEMATKLIKMGIHVPVGDPIGMLYFQQSVAKMQRVTEIAKARQAWRTGKLGMLQDRGEVDGAGYMVGRLKALEVVSGLDAEHLYERYDMVIYLDVPPREIYDAIKADNPARYEEYPEAVATGEAIKQVWSGHPNLICVGNYPTFGEKLAVVQGHIDRFIERIRSAA